MAGSVVFVSPFLKVNAWRSLWPCRELNRRGVPAVFVGHEGVHGYQTTASDVIVLHVTNQDVGASGFVRDQRRRGVRVWVQFDDCYRYLSDVQPEDMRGRSMPWTMAEGAAWAGDEFGPAFQPATASWYTVLMADHVQAIQEASGVIVSTPAILDGYRRWIGGDVRVIRNWLPRWVTEVPIRRHLPPLAGWFGHMGAHRRDVDLLAAGGRLDPFGVIGAADAFSSRTGWDLAKCWPLTNDQDQLYRWIGELSVGVAPLVDDRFNRCKSWIKPLEYAALGVPCVASDVTPYRDLLDDGFPVRLADDPAKMIEEVRTELEWGAGKAEFVGASLRQLVRERYTLQARGGDEWQEWAEANL